MQFLKILFLFILSIFFLTEGGYAGPKRFFSGEPKEERSSLTTAEQTSLNREGEERRTSAEEVLESEEDNLSAKRCRREAMSEIAEGPSQVATETSFAVHGDNSSSSLVHSVVPTRLLWTKEPPTLYRLALERLMSLSPTHSLFNEGLPPQLYIEVIEPCYNSMREMIQNLHKICQQYDLYRLSKRVKQEEHLIIFKKQLQEKLGAFIADLRAKNYPYVLFQIDQMRMVFSELQMVIKNLKEVEDLKKENLLALWSHNHNHWREGLVGNLIKSLHQHTQIVLQIVKGKQQLAKSLLFQRPSVDEVDHFRQRLSYQEYKLTRLTSLIEQQKIFLAHAEQFTLVQGVTMEEISLYSLQLLNLLDPAWGGRDEERDRTINAQLNICDQMMKVFVSTDPQVKRMQEKIMKVNERLAFLTSKIVATKMEQRNMILVREGRLSILRSNTLKVQPEPWKPIFDLYEVPYSFLEKNVTLLEQAKADFVRGKRASSAIKSLLADRWKHLAEETAYSVNVLSQLGMIVKPEDLLKEQQMIAKNQLLFEEQELRDKEASLPIDQDIHSLSWDFEKTFEENVAALHRFEL